jgi:hypothetical protein
VLPTVSEPEIVGAEVLTGAPPPTLPAVTVTRLVPAEFCAVTMTTRRCPVSADTTLYDALVAPPIGAQLPPLVSQRNQP